MDDTITITLQILVNINTVAAADDVIKWKHFPCNWPFVRGIHRSPVNSPYKGQWRGALQFSFICVWINDWVNNRKAGDLRRYHAHYDVIVMCWIIDLATQETKHIGSRVIDLAVQGYFSYATGMVKFLSIWLSVCMQLLFVYRLLRLCSSTLTYLKFYLTRVVTALATP